MAVRSTAEGVCVRVLASLRSRGTQRGPFASPFSSAAAPDGVTADDGCAQLAELWAGYEASAADRSESEDRKSRKPVEVLHEFICSAVSSTPLYWRQGCS